MRTLIAGRLIFALIGLAVVAVPVIVIKGVVMDKVDEYGAGFERPGQPDGHRGFQRASTAPRTSARPSRCCRRRPARTPSC